MKDRKWNILVYVHSVLFLWALLFICSLIVPGSGSISKVLAIGNIFFLFLNIPLSIFSFARKAKGQFDLRYEGIAVALSILNIIVGIAAWFFTILLIQMP